MSEFGTIQAVTQLELENFAETLKEAPEGKGGSPLSAQEVRQRNEAARLALKDKLEEGGIPEWAETYHRLLNANWPWRVALYVAWASMPRQRRLPKTQEILATDYMGLTSDRQIAEWRKAYPIDQMVADLQADELLEDRADVFSALRFMATLPDYKAHNDRKLYLEMIGAYVPVTKLAAELRKRGISADDLADLSVSELREIVGTATKKLEETED